MGKGRPRAVEKGVLGQTSSSSSSQALAVPQAPVYYPTESEFEDPLSFIAKIRPEAESYGICRIVPPKSWAPPFALDLSTFSFLTKSQAIHRLQSRPAACDPATFELEYTRFLQNHCGRKPRKRTAVIVFEGEDLNLCYLFNAVKRFGGYDKVVKEKKWGDVFRFIRSDDKKKKPTKITECAKHVLCQLYREHLYDYEEYCNGLSCGNLEKDCKRKSEDGVARPRSSSSKKRRRRNGDVKIEKEAELDNLDQICEQCKSGLHGEVMLLCDRCNKGWHLYCLTPPLEKVPPGNWYCLGCVNSDKDSFGFIQGKRLLLDAFKKEADKVKRKWLGAGGPANRAAIERRFWDIVEGSMGKVEVMYGSDLDTSVYGSGFPRENDPLPPSVELEVWKKYCSSPWNLNNLPKLEGSMLQAVRDNIAGVMVPWLYVGMLFSSFCWHFEDHCFYSMNYLHWGEPKYWYSVPGSEAQAFEQVMRNTLPDLFDAQPDLLFQLVTMLNPSVLQEHGVPVYSVLQEPGNFVITFPRSFHGGFNFGLNCAEAVNFAPADWLPHGGIGADLYRLYHKAPVLSHEELLCVLAKGSCTSKVSPYLKEEMLRVYEKEKRCREELWRNGIIKSSPMSPHKQPEYVGTEEDATCIICQQYLYLAAVECSCRPSAFVCLEHWEHLCECDPSKHCLLYRHTLAELSDMAQMVTTSSVALRGLEEAPQTCLQESSCPDGSNALSKKLKGGHVTHRQLAEDWLSRSLQIFQMSFTDAAYSGALGEAEQFLWAGHEMDPVRHMASELSKAKKWAVDLKNCLSKVETWMHTRCGDTGKVPLIVVEELVFCDPAPCIEPAHPNLKAFAEEARRLLLEIKSALSLHSCVTIADLEALYVRTTGLPILFEESRTLAREISSAKVWLDNVRKCLSKKKRGAVEVDVLYKLKSEMSDLCIQLPEMDLLSELLRQVESWRIQCNEVLRGPITLKELEVVLQDANEFTVNIAELNLLRKYHSDAVSWICHFNETLAKISERQDHSKVAEELACILEAGESLKVHVDELPLVREELRKSCCREKALKSLHARMPLDFIQELMKEAALLEITEEKLFLDISEVLKAALSWEESAKLLLGSMGQMSEFEESLRTSENIFAILPSLHDVKEALTLAESWIRASQPFLISTVCSGNSQNPLLKVDSLKELAIQSKLLKVSLKAPEMLQSILKGVESWELDASSLLEDAESLFNMHNIGERIDNRLCTRIETLLCRMDATTQSGLSLGFDFYEIPKLHKSSSQLRWSLKVLSFCSSAPSFKEVDNLIEDAKHLSEASTSKSLARTLIDSATWIRKALMVIPEPDSRRRCKLKDVEDVMAEAQRIKVAFPVMVAQLVNAIEKHKSWQEQVHAFFKCETRERSWPMLLQLQECGVSVAFDCPERDMVASEIEKVEKWMMRCRDIVGLADDDLSLPSILVKIKDSLGRALCMYHTSKSCSTKAFCTCCSSDSEDKNVSTCLICKDRYHLSCMKPSLATAGMVKEYRCPFCISIENGAVFKNAGWTLMLREKRPELKMFEKLLVDSKDFCTGVKERDMVQEILDQALACKSFLTDTVNHVLGYLNKDLNIVSEELLVALKAVAVAGVFDSEGSCNLELALTRNSWKIRVQNILKGPKKPFIQQIQRMLKEGSAMNMSSEDHFMQELTTLKRISLQWMNNAKKVALDSGALGLEEVFKLITEGENLPVQFEKELKLLRARSVLYCICRKPYDQRAMIACDQCDEWYHFDCINLDEPPPKTFICPACKPLTADVMPLSPSMHHEERLSTDDGPQTPPPLHVESKRRRPRKARSSLQLKMQVATDLISVLRCSSETDHLWRKSRRPFKRTARKRCTFERLLSPLFNQQQ